MYASRLGCTDRGATQRTELAEILEMVRDLETMRDGLDPDGVATLEAELRRAKGQFVELALRWAAGR